MSVLGNNTVAPVPAVTAAEMREIDRLAVDDFGIRITQMMEMAGANLARLAANLVAELAGSRVTVLVGTGNNGAGGLVAARHLVNRGALVHVVLAHPVARLNELGKQRLATLIEMSAPCCVAQWDLADRELQTLLARSDLLIDALLGYSAVGPPHGPVRELIAGGKSTDAKVLSLDLPSGIDPDSGEVDGVAFRSAATMTLALPKAGLLTRNGSEHAGTLYLADIGLPPSLYARAGLTVDPFMAGPLLRLD